MDSRNAGSWRGTIYYEREVGTKVSGSNTRAPGSLSSSVAIRRASEVSAERQLADSPTVSGRAHSPKLAREGDEEIVPAVRTSHPSDAVLEDAAIEIAVDGWLDAAAQDAMLLLKLLLVDEQEAFEVLRESSIENRAFGMA